MTPTPRARLSTADGARDYMLAGKAIVTLLSTKSGKRFTYRIVKKTADGPHFVNLLRGPRNSDGYEYLGVVFDAERFKHSHKSCVAPSAPSFRAFAWAFERLTAGVMPSDLEVWHEGKCGACGRRLTVPTSIAMGLGPTCAGKVAA